MAIRRRHEAPLEVTAAAAGSVGATAGQAQGMQLTNEMLRFLAQMDQRDRHFDVSKQLQLDAQNRADQRYYAGLAASGAARQQGLQANLLNAERARQASTYNNYLDNLSSLQQEQLEQQGAIANDQRDLQGQLLRDQIQAGYDATGRQFDWQMEAAQSIDQQVRDTIKSLNDMKLTPEGQRLKNEWVGKVRQAQAQRGVLRPDAYAKVMQQAMDQYSDLGLDAYAEPPPDPVGQFMSGLVPLDGQQVAHGQPLPPGRYVFQNGVRNGAPQWKEYNVPGATAATQINEKDYDKTYRAAYSELLAEAQLMATDGKALPPTTAQVHERMRQNAAAKAEFYGLEQQGGGFPPVFPTMPGAGLFGAMAGAAAMQPGSAPQSIAVPQVDDMSGPPTDAVQTLPEDPSQQPQGDPLDELLDRFANDIAEPRSIEEVQTMEPGKLFRWGGRLARRNEDGSITVVME